MHMRITARTMKTMAAMLITCLLLPSAVSAQEQQITEVVITGNERISKEAVLAVMAVKPGMAFSEQAVNEAKQAIQAMGYFERVVVGTETEDAGVRIVFDVIENPVVEEIKITGNTVVDTEKLLSLMRTSVGSVLNMNTFLQQDVPAVERDYRGKGYIAYVTEEIGIDPETGVLTIPILEVTVEGIRVTGNRKTKDYVILREMELEAGDVFNREILMRDVRRIYDFDFFDIEAAEPYRLEAGSDLGNVVIIIPVKERRTGQISIGLGYSSRQRLVGQAKISEINFRGRGQAVNLLWEVGSRTRGTSYEVGFFEPWLDSKHTSLGISVYNKLIFRFTSDVLGTSGDVDTDYDERRQGGSITVSRPFSRTTRGFVTLRTESVDTEIDDLSPSLSVISQDGSVTSGTFRFTNDGRDSLQDPLTGTYSSYALELGKASFRSEADLESDSAFTKYSGDLRRYFSKGGPREDLSERRRVIALRVMAGSLTGNVPFFEQYFMGGAETLRGFREDRFWGRHMFLLSTEYRFPLAPSLGGVAFVDYGDAWGAREGFLDIAAFGDDLRQHSDFSPSLGYGVGIRVRTPIGPIRLDYGFSSEGSRAHFSLGHVF